MNVWRGVQEVRMRFRLGAVLLLCAVTVAVFNGGFRYETVASGIVPGITAGGWAASANGVGVLKADPSVVILAARGTRNFPFLVNRLGDPQRFDLIRVSVELAAKKLRSGPERWQQGRVLFRSLDGAGRRMRYVESEAGAVAGTADWRTVRMVVPVEPETRLFRLIVYNAGAGGIMAVRNLAVDAVAETLLFTFLRFLLVVLWAGAALWALLPLFARRRWRFLPAATMFVALLILAGTLTPQPEQSNALRPVAIQLQRIALSVFAGVQEILERDEADDRVAVRAETSPGRGGQGVADRPKIPAMKTVTPRRPAVDTMDPVIRRLGRLGLPDVSLMAHFVSFMLLGLVAAAAYPGILRRNLLGCLAVFAVADETLQFFLYSRSVETGDYLWNAAGVVMGAALWWIPGWMLGRKPPLPAP